MRIKDPVLSEKTAKVLTEPNARRIICATTLVAKSTTQIAEELDIPIRSVYRHISELCEVGILASERWMPISYGGKYALYRSLVKSITINYDSTDSHLEIDLIPNESNPDKFMRFWTLMGR